MVHLGRFGTPLIDESFEAWDYGPVVPLLYHKMKIFGADPVGDRFYNATSLAPETDAVLVEVCEKLKNYSGGQLVANTHNPRGAWAANYAPRSNKAISNDDIIKEYRTRTSR